MNCREARESIVGRALDGETRRHLATCAACREEVEWERALTEAFATLRREYPASLDVAPAVVRRVRAGGRPGEASDRHLAAAGIAAVLALIAVAGGGARLAVSRERTLEVLSALGDACVSIARAGAATVWAVLRVPLEIAAAILEPLLTSGVVSSRLVSLSWSFTAAAALVMTLIVATVLARELFAPPRRRLERIVP